MPANVMAPDIRNVGTLPDIAVIGIRVDSNHHIILIIRHPSPRRNARVR